jgi:hypothetical protein
MKKVGSGKKKGGGGVGCGAHSQTCYKNVQYCALFGNTMLPGAMVCLLSNYKKNLIN